MTDFPRYSFIGRAFGSQLAFPARASGSCRVSNIDLYANHVTCTPRFHEPSRSVVRTALVQYYSDVDKCIFHRLLEHQLCICYEG